MTSIDHAPKRKPRPSGRGQARQFSSGAEGSPEGWRRSSDREAGVLHKDRLLARLSRIDGQVRGVARMVGEDRDCLDVLTQLAAVKAALNQVAMQLLENQTRRCVARAMRDGDSEAATAELLAVLKRIDGKAFG